MVPDRDDLGAVTTALRKAKQDGALLDVLLQLRPEDGDDRKSYIAHLVSLHNSGELDLLAEYRKLRNGEKPDFWLTRIILEEALPNLSGSPSDVAHCVLHLITEAGQDLTSNTPVSAFRQFLDASEERPAEMLVQIESDPVTFSRLMPVTIAAGSAKNREFFINEAVRLARNSLIDLRRPAVFSLGSFELLEHEEIPEQVVKSLEEIVAEMDDDGVLASAVDAAASLYRKDRKAAIRLEQIIRNALQKGGEWVLAAASRAFAFRVGSFGPSLVEALATPLREVPLSSTGVVKQIDYGISSLLDSENREVAISLFEAMLRRSSLEKQLRQFECSKSVILGSSLLLSKIVTRWLSSGEHVLCLAAAELVQEASYRDLVIEADPNEVSHDDHNLTFTARKAVSFLFFWPVIATSFVLSLMRLGGVEQLKQLLLDPLLLNYTGSIQELLAERSKTECAAVSQGINDCLRVIEDYLTSIRSAVNLRELRPSATEQAAFHRLFNQKMSASFAAAQAEMPLLSIVKRSVILHGRGSVQHVTHPDGTAHRADMIFKTQGTEMVLPRMGQIDEIGLQLQLRILRAERKTR